MLTTIVYASKTRITQDQIAIPICDETGAFKFHMFIRTTLIKGDLLESLDQAKPLEGETVLNSWSPYGQS